MIARFIMLFTLLCAGMMLAQQSEQISSVSVPVDPISGSVDLAGGSHARYTYHFDHNALTDGVLTGQSLLAITDSGNLLEFNAETLELTGQVIVPGRAVSIAAESKDSVLIGTFDGHIFRARTRSLQLETVTSTSGNVVWLSAGPSTSSLPERIVFVLDRSPDLRPWPGEGDKAFKARERAAALRVANTYAVEVFEKSRLRELPFPKLRLFTIPGHYLLDSHDRLWMGADNGEWGGKCYLMNLRTGAVKTMKDGINGVLGFFITPQGRTIVYGGMAHMGMYEGYIADLKPDGISNIAKFEHNSWGQPAEDTHLPEAVRKVVKEAAERLAQESKEKPNGPVDLIESDSHGEGYWVVSEHVLFHADREFKVWQRVTDLGGRWIGGRRFSVGGTPTINQLFEDPSGSNGLIALMGRDGLERISNGKIERRSFAGQLESAVLDMWKTTKGLMFVGADFEDRSPWKQEGNQWRRYSLFPDEPPAADGTEWSFAEPFGNDGSHIDAFAHDNLGGGTAFMVDLNGNDRAKVIDSWPGDSSQFETAFLVTSHGVVLKTVDKQLFKRNGKNWESVGISEYSSTFDRRGTMNGREFVLLGTANGSDIFLETNYGDLYQLAKTDTGSDRYSLSRARFNDQSAPDAVFDAVPEPSNRVLLTTAQGILELNLDTGHRSSIPSPHRGEVFTSVCRDGQNRLWAVGDFLYLSSDEGLHWTEVNLPMLTHTSPKRIRVNPEATSQMILMLEERGLATIDIQ